MAGLEEFQHHKGHFLTQVDLKTRNSNLHAPVLTQLLSPVSAARSVGELHKRILASMESLNRLKLYQRLEVKMLPGSRVDTALIEYDFQCLKWWDWGLRMGGSREGGCVLPSMLLRNIRGGAEQTSATLEFKPNTMTWGLRLDHVSPAILPTSWALALNYHIKQKQLDLNLHVLEKGEAVTFTSHDGSNAVIVGREVRTNCPYIDRASMQLLQSAILTSEKYYIAHEWRTSSLDEGETQGHYLRIRNELAVGSSTQAHTLDLTCTQFFQVHDNGLILELTGWWRWMPGWTFTKVHYNDRLRATYIKGFRSIGERNPPADGSLEAHFNAPGDSVGSTNVITAEAKLHFRKNPLLHLLGLSPFLYGNIVGAGLDVGRAKQGIRWSAGMGVDWKTRFGRVELTYAAKVFTRQGDLPAEFQVLYYG